MIPYSFHPEAAAELEDASAFYESCSTGLGSVFAVVHQGRRPGYWRRRK